MSLVPTTSPSGDAKPIATKVIQPQAGIDPNGYQALSLTDAEVALVLKASTEQGNQP